MDNERAKTDAEFLAEMGTDAQKWARTFLSMDFDPDNLDEGLMIGWFANAIEAGRSAGTHDHAALIAENKALREELRKAMTPSWFYHPDYTEYCMWSPYEVVDEQYDPEPGDHVFEVECAKPLPSIWCAVRVTADEDADGRFTLTEHPTEDAARQALKDTPNGQ